MHDFAEGIITWFLQRAFEHHNITADMRRQTAARLEEQRKLMCSTLQWPKLAPDELTRWQCCKGEWCALSYLAI